MELLVLSKLTPLAERVFHLLFSRYLSLKTTLLRRWATSGLRASGRGAAFCMLCACPAFLEGRDFFVHRLEACFEYPSRFCHL